MSNFTFTSPNRLNSSLRRNLLCLLAIATVGMTAQPIRADLLEYWDFNNDRTTFSGSTFGSLSTTGTGTTNASGNGEVYNGTTKVLTSNSSVGAIFSNGTLNLSGLVTTNGGNSGVTGTPPAWGVYQDTPVNLAATDHTTGGSLLMVNAPNDTDSLVFSLDSAGYSNLTFSAAERFSTGVTPTVTWYVDTTNDSNLANWTVVTPTGTAGNASFATISLNLSSLYSNQGTFYIQEVAQFSSAQGSLGIDNVQLNGALAVPEPSTWAFLLSGMTGLFFLVRLQRARRS